MNEILEQIASINSIVNNFVWSIPTLGLIIITGIYFTLKTRFFQLRKSNEVYNHTFKTLFAKKTKKSKNKKLKKSNEKIDKKNISSFQALTTALASTIGTGNIAGVSSALCLGGPGAIFWMWICAFFGMMTKYSEIILGMFYRKKNDHGEYKGGSMYYLEYGVGSKKGMKILGKALAVIFALVTFLACLGIGNMTQINSIADAMKNNFSLAPYITGVITAILVALIIIGGIKRIGMVTEKLVPLMSVIYIIVALFIIITNFHQIPYVFSSIFKCAFNTKAFIGGGVGYLLKRALTYGFKRGAFSNEAGLGSSVMAHTASNEAEPVKQAMWGIFEVFFDTIIICTLTAFIILSSEVSAPTLNVALNNINNSETVVCLSDTKINDKGYMPVLDDECNLVPIKLDMDSNAKLYTYDKINTNPSNYFQVNIDQHAFFVEKLNPSDATENDYIYGNIIKLKPNTTINSQTGEVIYDSLHMEKLNGVALVTYAVSTKMGTLSGKIIAICVLLFAFSTIVGWSYYGSNAIEYLGGEVAGRVYKIFYVLFVFVGATMNLNLVWDISDTMNGFMAIPNLIGVLICSGTVIKITKNFFDRKKGLKVKPLISYWKK